MSFWQDVRDIKVGYIVFVGAVVLGGKAIVDEVFDDDDSGGNTPSWEEQQEFNRIEIEKMLEDSVMAELPKQRFIDRLGSPERTQLFDDGTEILMYRTRHSYSDGKTNWRETVPLIFSDGVLVGYSLSSNWTGRDRATIDADDEEAEARTRASIAALDAGVPMFEVMAELGEPDFRDYPGDRYEILSYQTGLRDFGRASADREETTALLFFEDKLVGRQVGQFSFMDSDSDSDSDSSSITISASAVESNPTPDPSPEPEPEGVIDEG